MCSLTLIRNIASIAISILFATSCGRSHHPIDVSLPLETPNGRLKILSYNINGIPTDLGYKRIPRTIKIARELNKADYDLILLQENFAFDEVLREKIDHEKFPYQSEHKRRTTKSRMLQDGLDQFSRHPFVDYTRVQWAHCHGDLIAYIDSRIRGKDNGSDCTAEKGFTFSIHELASNRKVHVYNLHMDAGNTDPDYNVRALQAEQLLHFIRSASYGQPTIIAGDFNIHINSQGRDNETWRYLRNHLGKNYLKTACLRPAYSDTSCPDGPNQFLYHEGDNMVLQPKVYLYDSQFQDTSDHDAIMTEFSWRFD